ncbi:dGTP triphosphohydrolase [Neisseria sicca]|jgi:putative dGTPase|uniref:dGTP triphosphohydrolase n=1 Tax=Neisseria sicca TaxID=490 RepID=UPI0008A54AC1|nr:dNTP triphosphohydrolase [Neisseria sicca]QTM23729.1 dNTP triphosphohydrolase [Neisseria sicca]
MDDFSKLFNLISDKRLRESKSERAQDSDIVIASESDKSRVINASAFRRLQQKAQVFSLETNASVRTRLTHSIEVSQIGRYLAQEIIRLMSKDSDISYEKKLAFSNIIETACLLHDIGNPPFGHLGEAAIRRWFKKKQKQLKKGSNIYEELIKFDGNAQGFRLITYLSGADEYGLNLTASTILAFVKYPFINKDKGLFKADYQFSYKVACKKLEWKEGVKFPLAIIMDLADEISYCMSDLEDGLEKRVISPYDLYMEFKDIGYLEPKEEDMYPYPFITFKTKLINKCVQEIAQKFVDNIGNIVEGEMIEIPIDDNDVREKYLGRIKKFARKRIYSDRKIELVELAGAKIIEGLLEEYEPLLDMEENNFSQLINGEKGKEYPFEFRLINTIPKNYIKKYQKSMDYYRAKRTDTPSEKSVRAQLLVDFISGMTDDFALEQYQFLKGIKLHD